jgi:hypothetical protein
MAVKKLFILLSVKHFLLGISSAVWKSASEKTIGCRARDGHESEEYFLASAAAATKLEKGLCPGEVGHE